MLTTINNFHNYAVTIIKVFVYNDSLGFLPSSSASTGNMSPKICPNSDTEGSSTIPDTRIEDGKLLFEKRWYGLFIITYFILNHCFLLYIIVILFPFSYFCKMKTGIIIINYNLAL